MGFTDIEHVYIGAVIELVSAQLSHRNDGEACFYQPSLPILMHRDTMTRPQVVINNAISGIDQNRSQIGEGAGGFHHIGQSEKIAHTDTQHLSAAESPERV